MTEDTMRAWAEIDTKALIHNLELAKSLTGKRIMSVCSFDVSDVLPSALEPMIFILLQSVRALDFAGEDAELKEKACVFWKTVVQ